MFPLTFCSQDFSCCLIVFYSFHYVSLRIILETSLIFKDSWALLCKALFLTEDPGLLVRLFCVPFVVLMSLFLFFFLCFFCFLWILWSSSTFYSRSPWSWSSLSGRQHQRDGNRRIKLHCYWSTTTSVSSHGKSIAITLLVFQVLRETNGRIKTGSFLKQKEAMTRMQHRSWCP